jgi:hypothetical protein
MQSVIFVDVRRCLPGQCGNVIASRYDCYCLAIIFYYFVDHGWCVEELSEFIYFFLIYSMLIAWLQCIIRWMHACMDGWVHGCMQIEQLRAAGLIKGGSLENALVCRYIEYCNCLKMCFLRTPTPNLMLLTMWDDECHSLVAPACNIPYYYANLCSTLIWYLGVIATKFPSGPQVLIIRRICQPAYNVMIFELSVLEGPCWRFSGFCSLLVKFEVFYKQSWSCFMVIWVQ